MANWEGSGRMGLRSILSFHSCCRMKALRKPHKNISRDSWSLVTTRIQVGQVIAKKNFLS